MDCFSSSKRGNIVGLNDFDDDTTSLTYILIKAWLFECVISAKTRRIKCRAKIPWGTGKPETKLSKKKSSLTGTGASEMKTWEEKVPLGTEASEKKPHQRREVPSKEQKPRSRSFIRETWRLNIFLYFRIYVSIRY